jgi:hypothetical protein
MDYRMKKNGVLVEDDFLVEYSGEWNVSKIQNFFKTKILK